MSDAKWVIVSVSGEVEPEELRDQLVESGVDARLVVAVPAENEDGARGVLASLLRGADPSSDLDLETIGVFQGIDAEIEVVAIQALLEQSGISVVVESAPGLPSVPVTVKVARSLAATAREILETARTEGAAAVDAETAGD